MKNIGNLVFMTEIWCDQNLSQSENRKGENQKICSHFSEPTFIAKTLKKLGV